MISATAWCSMDVLCAWPAALNAASVPCAICATTEKTGNDLHQSACLRQALFFLQRIECDSKKMQEVLYESKRYDGAAAA